MLALIRVTCSAADLRTIANGYIDDGPGRRLPLATIVEDRGGVALNVGPLTDSDTAGALSALAAAGVIEAAHLAAWRAELP